MLKRYLISIFLLLTLAASEASESCKDKWDLILQGDFDQRYSSVINKCNTNLKRDLWEIIKTNKYLAYRDAREYFFSDLDNRNGRVAGVYSNSYITTDSIPDYLKMNCEHSWPQSLGAVGKAKSDMHHLFPALAGMNTLRSNLPFCEVGEIIVEKYGSKKGWSKISKTKCFEPRSAHKGDLSRAMFYFSLRYSKPIDPEQEYWFRKWSNKDKISRKERNRNDGIEYYQNNRNPFVDAPEMLNLIDDF